MKGVGGSGLVIIGAIFLWLAISGRFDCFYAFLSCMMNGNANATANGNKSGNVLSSLPALPSLPALSQMLS